MNKYEKLLQEAADHKIKIYDFDLGDDGLDGLYMDGNIALSDKLETSCQKACVLAEELGHYHTSVGDILDPKDIENQKQERYARGWAYKKLVPLEDIRKVYQSGYTETFEMAERLEVDERFLKDSLEYYQQKYGPNLFHEEDENMLSGLLKMLEERT